MEKPRIRSAFDKSAPIYEQNADLQNAVARDLARRVKESGLSGSVAMDVGCGAGALALMISKSGAYRTTIASDLSMGMVKVARGRVNGAGVFSVAQADVERLPVKPASVDLIVSNLMLQWVENLPLALREMASALAEGGRLMATTLGRNTFYEIREAATAALSGLGMAADQSIFHKFTDEAELSEAAEKAGFETRLWKSERVMVYKDFKALLKTLKRQGVQNSVGLSALGLGRRKVMEKLAEEYHERFSTPGGVRITYEILHLDARRI